MLAETTRSHSLPREPWLAGHLRAVLVHFRLSRRRARRLRRLRHLPDHLLLDVGIDPRTVPPPGRWQGDWHPLLPSEMRDTRSRSRALP